MDSVRKRVANYRRRLREAGLRPVQIWVPDTRRPGFAEECQRQSSALRGDPAEKAALDFIERVGEWGEGR